IAQTRSKASSLSSSSGLSPPPMLTPTLLCRISMRPQRARAASIAAASVSSLVTSAAKGTHSLPRVAIAAVSSAEAISRSTARILAPSCAKQSVVARPFPIPSPGLCSAPTITAPLPSRRMAALLATGVQGCLYGASLRKSARASRLLAYRILYPRCARVAGREAWEPEPGRPGTIEDEPGWEESIPLERALSTPPEPHETWDESRRNGRPARDGSPAAGFRKVPREQRPFDFL